MVKVSKQLGMVICGVLIFGGVALAEETKGRSETWFDKLDADNDDQVSKEEFIGTWSTWFSRQDTNNDDHLNYEEWTRTHRHSSDSKMRNIFAAFDKDGDKKVSAKEHNTVRKNQFEAADEDNDGYWTRSEAVRQAGKSRE